MGKSKGVEMSVAQLGRTDFTFPEFCLSWLVTWSLRVVLRRK